MAQVTVIIPAYNAEEFVRFSLQSALEQKASVAEVILVDDGSTDRTVEVAESCGGVRVLRQRNRGAAAARNAGLQLASGEFVVFLDADDVLHATATEDHLEPMEADPDLTMVFGSNRVIDAANQVIQENWLAKRRVDSAADIALGITPCPSQCMYRKAALDVVGGYDSSLRAAEDDDLNMRVLQHGSILCHGKMVMDYRQHSGQATRTPAFNCRVHMNVLRKNLGRYGLAPDPDALEKGSRLWKRYYGQFIPSEIVRAALSGDVQRATSATTTFFRCLPYSGAGAIRFTISRVRESLSADRF